MSDGTQTKKLSRSLKTFYGVGDFGFTMMSNIDTFYASYFFINIAMFPLAVVTVMTTISAIVDLILSSMYGAWMNKIKPRKWGRYRSWLILTPWLVPFLYALEFLKIGNTTVCMVTMTLAMITSRIAWNIPYIANLSMINVAGKTTGDRMALSSIRSVWTALGSVIYSYVGPFVVAKFAASVGEQNAYAATAFAFGAFTAAAFFAHFVMFNGYEESGEEETRRLQSQQGGQTGSAPKVSAAAAVFCNPHLIFLMLASMTKYIVLFLVNSIAIYYFTYITHNEALFPTFMLVTSLLGVVASYTSKYFVAKLGSKRTVFLSYIAMGVCMLIAYAAFRSTAMVIVLMSLTFFGLNLSTAVDPELYALCAGFSSQKTGYDTTGTVMGLLTVPLKFGIVMRGILVSVALSIGGFSAEIDPATASAAVQRGICIGFMVIPAVVVLAGALLFQFGYRLTPPKAKG